MRITIHHLITAPTGLGYCCDWLFFSRYKETALISSRLGLSIRCVQYAKSSFDKGCLHCEKKPNCMMRVIRRPRLKPLPAEAECSATSHTDPQTGPAVAGEGGEHSLSPLPPPSEVAKV